MIPRSCTCCASLTKRSFHWMDKDWVPTVKVGLSPVPWWTPQSLSTDELREEVLLQLVRTLDVVVLKVMAVKVLKKGNEEAMNYLTGFRSVATSRGDGVQCDDEVSCRTATGNQQETTNDWRRELSCSKWGWANALYLHEQHIDIQNISNKTNESKHNYSDKYKYEIKRHLKNHIS